MIPCWLKWGGDLRSNNPRSIQPALPRPPPPPSELAPSRPAPLRLTANPGRTGPAPSHLAQPARLALPAPVARRPRAPLYMLSRSTPPASTPPRPDPNQPDPPHPAVLPARARRAPPRPAPPRQPQPTQQRLVSTDLQCLALLYPHVRPSDGLARSSVYGLLLDGVWAPLSDGDVFIRPAKTCRARLTGMPRSPRPMRTSSRAHSRQLCPHHPPPAPRTPPHRMPPPSPRSRPDNPTSLVPHTSSPPAWCRTARRTTCCTACAEQALELLVTHSPQVLGRDPDERGSERGEANPAHAHPARPLEGLPSSPGPGRRPVGTRPIPTDVGRRSVPPTGCRTVHAACVFLALRASPHPPPRLCF